jgi:hypothetical protein
MGFIIYATYPHIHKNIIILLDRLYSLTPPDAEFSLSEAPPHFELGLAFLAAS